jgi:hypothetical protein
LFGACLHFDFAGENRHQKTNINKLLGDIEEGISVLGPISGNGA